jgi:DNA-directed RNA polymerase specialized sigma24 family protein
MTMDEETKELLKSIDNRLKWLLQLRAEERLEEEDTNKQKVKILYQMGFSNQEMAQIIGTSPGSVRGTVSKLKDEKKID